MAARPTFHLRHRQGPPAVGVAGHREGADTAGLSAAIDGPVCRHRTHAGGPRDVVATQTVTLTKPVAAPEPQTHREGEIACDEALFERLRRLRKQLADEQAVPPYIIFSDVSLRQMARQYPTNEREFARISGVGERKLREFGAAFLAEIAAHLQTNPRQIFADNSFDAPQPSPRPCLGDSARETHGRRHDRLD